MAESAKKPAPDLKRRFFSFPTLVAFGIAAAFIAFVLARFDVDLHGTWANIRNANPWLFVLAFFINYATFAFRAVRWRVLLRNVQEPERPVPGVPKLAGIILVSWFANCITWFRLGDAYRAYMYAGETKATFSRTIGTILAERVYDVVVVFLLLVAAFLALLLDAGDGPSWWFIVVALALVAGMVGIVLAMVFFQARILRLLPERARQVYERFYQGTVGSFKRMPQSLALGVLAWMAEVGRLYFVVQALGLHLSLAMVLFVTLANSILTLVPLTPGGLGIVESGLTGVLMLALAQPDALSVALLDRSISYLSIIIVGALLFVGWEVVKRRRARPAATESQQVS